MKLTRRRRRRRRRKRHEGSRARTKAPPPGFFSASLVGLGTAQPPETAIMQDVDLPNHANLLPAVSLSLFLIALVEEFITII